MNDLINDEQELLQCEADIEEGIKHFVKTGNALLRIRDKKFYLRRGYKTFEEYCKKKYNISMSEGYHLMSAAGVVNSLGSSSSLPERSSHASKLSILKDDETRRSAWQEVVTIVERPEDITGELVGNVARKHHVLHNGDSELSKKVRLMQITPDRAYRLQDMLGKNKMPLYVQDAIRLYGFEGNGVDPETIKELRLLEYSFKEDVMGVWCSGYLDSGRGDPIPLHRITVRDVDNYKRKLAYEQTQTRKIEAGQKQNDVLTGSSTFVADGFDIPEILDQFRDNSSIGFLFPDGQLTPKQLARSLESKGYQVLFVAAYINNPLINFNGEKQPITSINGVKPKWITDAIKSSIIQ
jgi:hypothetical protein